MDEIFKQFQSWFISKKDIWKQNGIAVDEAESSEFRHQYWIKLHSEYGLGTIILHESNGRYWVDFEGGNYDYDVMFQRTGIEFNNINELDIHERDLVKQITWSGDDD